MTDELENRLRESAEDYPSPDAPVTADARASFLAAATRRRSWLPAGRATRAAVFAVAFAACAGAAFGAGLTIADDGPPLVASGAAGPGFLPAPGWNVLNSGLTVPLQGPTAIAANIALSPHDRELGGRPDDTIRSLDESGILLYALFIPSGQIPEVDGQFPERTLPLRLDDADAGSIEGAPASGETLRLLARAGGYDMDILIFFGAREPSAAVRAAAGEQLRRLVVPSCPIGTLPVDESDRAEAGAYVRQWLGLHYHGRASDLEGANVRAHVVGVDLVPQWRRAVSRREAETLAAECPDASGRLIVVQVSLSAEARATVGRFPLSYLVVRTKDGWTIWRQL